MNSPEEHFQSARVMFFNVRRGYGRVQTSDSRVYLPLQALRDAGLLTLERDTVVEVKLDDQKPARVEQLRIPAPVPTKKKR